jgi:hypothetical protein
LREVVAPTFSDIRLIDGGKVYQPYAPAAYYPQENSWHSFLLETESTPELEELRKFIKSTSSGIRTGDLPACRIVPQPITLLRAPRNV